MLTVSKDHRPNRPLMPFLVVTALLIGLALASSGAAAGPWPKSPLSGAGLLSTHTLTFQYGAGGYTGVADSYMNVDDGYRDTNYGTGSEMGIRTGGPSDMGRQRPLIRFDLSIIPPGAVITRANLRLTLTSREWDVPSASVEVRVYRLNRAWVESEVTWNRPAAGQSWYGADSVPLDRQGTPVATRVLQPTDRRLPVYFDISQAVQEWVDDPASNYGLLFVGYKAGTSNGGYGFHSSQALTLSDRPFLEVTYEGPAPLHTPTPTYTPTLTPTPEHWNQIESSLSTKCIGAGPHATTYGWPDNTQVLLFWEGRPWSAVLVMDEASVQCGHSIYVNGQRIGQAYPEGGEYCSQGRTKEWTFDPSILVKGWNTIRIANDGPCYDNGWTATNIKIRLIGQVLGPGWEEITYGRRAPYDLKAWVQTPIGHDPRAPTPLVIVLHAWTNDTVSASASAMLTYAMAVNRKGWLLAAPQVLGGRTASLERQRDIINLINYMKGRYAVDARRIYLIGNSMGGGNAATIAAKYPDVFAAVAEEQGPTDLAEWYEYCKSKGGQWMKYVDGLYTEIGGAPYNGGYPTAYLIEYQRRSSRQMAQNLKHVPVLITHGSADQIVPVGHGRLLYEALRFHGADEAEYHEFSGGHGEVFPGDATLGPSPDGLLDFLGRHALPAEPPREIHIRNDELIKKYYWLTIEQHASGSSVTPHWTDVHARYDPNVGSIWADVFDEITNQYIVRLTFHLGEMGLNPYVPYTVEIYQEEGGAFQHYLAMPSGGQLAITLTNPPAMPRHYHIQITSGQSLDPLSITFQQGVNGYWGTTDTYMKSYDPWANFGGEEVLNVNSSSQFALLKFDLSGPTGLPSPIIVHAAYLTLTTGWGSGDSDVSLYRVLRPWEEMEASWKEARRGDAWGAEGCNDTTRDRVSIADAVKRINAANTSFRFNVRKLVEYWINNPDRNYGVLLKASGAGSYQYHSSEYAWAPSLRPALKVIYIVATPSPTPTPTDTRTPTPTWTPTPSPTPTETHTPIYSPTHTPTSTSTPTFTVTATPTATATATSSPTATPSPTPNTFVIQGLAFEDANLNQQPDPGERPVAGVEVRIVRQGQVLDRRWTGSDGRYRFDTLPSGQYLVLAASLPPGYGAAGSLGVVEYVPPDRVVNFSLRQLPTDTPSPTLTATPSVTHTPTPTWTFTPSCTPTKTHTPSPTGTATATASYTPTASPTATGTATSSPTATMSPTATASPTITATPTPTPLFTHKLYLPILEKLARPR